MMTNLSRVIPTLISVILPPGRIAREPNIRDSVISVTNLIIASDRCDQDPNSDGVGAAVERLNSIISYHEPTIMLAEDDISPSSSTHSLAATRPETTATNHISKFDSSQINFDRLFRAFKFGSAGATIGAFVSGSLLLVLAFPPLAAVGMVAGSFILFATIGFSTHKNLGKILDGSGKSGTG